MSKRRNRLIQEFISGLSTSFIFGALWLVTGMNLWLFIGLFAGVLPSIANGGKLLADMGHDRQISREAPRVARVRQEKEILRVAKIEQGRVTPAVAALKSSCSVDEANSILESLVQNGYAQMDVDEHGRVAYVFPEFEPAEGVHESHETPAGSDAESHNDDDELARFRTGS